MKKIFKFLFTLSVFVLFQNTTFAIEDIQSYCPTEPYPVGEKLLLQSVK